MLHFHRKTTINNVCVVQYMGLIQKPSTFQYKNGKCNKTLKCIIFITISDHFTSGSRDMGCVAPSSNFPLMIDFRAPSSNLKHRETRWCILGHNTNINHKIHQQIIPTLSSYLQPVELVLQHDFDFEQSLLFLLQFPADDCACWWLQSEHHLTLNEGGKHVDSETHI